MLLALFLGLSCWLALRTTATGWAEDTTLTPFDSVRQAFEDGAAAGLRRLADGLLPLAPLGVLLPLAGGRLRTAWLPSFAQVVGATSVISTALEFLRTSWAGQVLNVDDMLLGVIGAGLLHLAVVPSGRALLRARLAAERAPSPSSPSEPPAAAGPRKLPVPLPGSPLVSAPRPPSLVKSGRG
ncbi:glycopeptide antibiotics resistance protein [Kitasatospora sp. MAA4]|uniref:VanZ family protein n=1 Tax=Kitasatospora sp. MAA4 TaxID=3035093 RepID=UPI002473E2D1|nr:VanZ family protein [Kitasatospora sp. MAA4]MDH6136000.1 glycopeptide antibiotics resistance protein [Kitasatospora sp. MAA4]